nr:DNA cytosine methyltransferase [Parvibaculum indicum]
MFTGCGGLALGISRAGFRSQRMVEWDRHSVANVQHNVDRKITHVADWPIHQEDVRAVDWSRYGDIDLVAGGPPCQPFSIGGRHRGHEDDRDMWPEAVRAVGEIEPRAFIFENVRGLTRVAFSDYLDWILNALAHPTNRLRDGESRGEHLSRLKRHSNSLYRVALTKVNAADYGAAQKRHRVIIVGVHRDLDALPPKLKATHSRERLLWDQWVTGEYWERHGVRPPRSGPAKSDIATVRRLKQGMIVPDGNPWRTVRDAIWDLGEPGTGDWTNHVLQPGAKSYPGHTGSPLDMPAKALKAGVHGVPGGENMLALEKGKVRYLTVREAARLQGLPDDYEFVGSWSENMRQLGNAVPTELSEAVAHLVGDVVNNNSSLKSMRKRAA